MAIYHDFKVGYLAADVNFCVFGLALVFKVRSGQGKLLIIDIIENKLSMFCEYIASIKIAFSANPQPWV